MRIRENRVTTPYYCLLALSDAVSVFPHHFKLWRNSVLNFGGNIEE
jgi:hypothetical protein